MKATFSKVAILVLSIMPVTVFASHWSYEGKGSPEHWGALSEEYKTCQTGMNQSPINIDTTLTAHLSPLDTHYTDGPMTLSEAQLKKFTQTMHHNNNRPEQPLNGR